MKQEYGFVPHFFNAQTEEFVSAGTMVESFLEAVKVIDSETGFGYVLVYKLADNFFPQSGVITPQPAELIGYFPVPDRNR
jgi:hypothetical protein